MHILYANFVRILEVRKQYHQDLVKINRMTVNSIKVYQAKKEIPTP